MRTAVVLSSLAVLLVRPLTSQVTTQPQRELGLQTASFSDHAKVFGVNALIGGVTATVFRLARGEPILAGFLGGAFGGGAVYGGKAVAARPFSGAGVLGRQLGAVGSSIVTNASNGVGPLDHLSVPLGPLPGRLHLTTRGEWSVQPLVDLLSAGALLYGLISPLYDLDGAESLSSGVAIFREADPSRINIVINESNGPLRGATTVGGAIFVSNIVNDFVPTILAHERVHVLQFDYFQITVGDQADSWFMDRYPKVDRVLKINWVPALLGAVNQTFLVFAERESLPWEREAMTLAGR